MFWHISSAVLSGSKTFNQTQNTEPVYVGWAWHREKISALANQCVGSITFWLLWTGYNGTLYFVNLKTRTKNILWIRIWFRILP
jgi:hypothetical protein